LNRSKAWKEGRIQIVECDCGHDNVQHGFTGCRGYIDPRGGRFFYDGPVPPEYGARCMCRKKPTIKDFPESVVLM